MEWLTGTTIIDCNWTYVELVSDEIEQFENTNGENDAKQYTVVNSGARDCLTSSEEYFSYIQNKIKLKNTKINWIEIMEEWGWLTGTTTIDCHCKRMKSWLVTNKKSLKIPTV